MRTNNKRVIYGISIQPCEKMLALWPTTLLIKTEKNEINKSATRAKKGCLAEERKCAHVHIDLALI